MTTHFLALGGEETFTDREGNTTTVPSAETLADKSYVTTLQCLAHKLNEHFHRECEAALAPVLAQIASEDEDAGYHRGPVKGLPRMNEKLAEYVEEGKPFPRAACVIDVLRNSVAFDSAAQILEAFKLLETHEGLQLTGNDKVVLVFPDW